MKYRNKLIRNILTLVGIVLLSIYIFQIRADFGIVLDIRYIYLLLLFFVTLAIFFLNGLFLKILMEPFGIKLKNTEAFGLSILTNFGNYFSFFFGGAAIKAVYFKKKYAFSYKRYLESLGLTYLLVFSINSLIAILSMVILFLKESVVSWIAFAVFFSIFVFSVSILVFPQIVKILPVSKIKNSFNSHSALSKDTGIKLIQILLLNSILGATAVMLKFGSIGTSLDFIQGVYVNSVAGLATFINLTPASIGITESLTAYAALIFNIAPAQALIATLIDRVVTLIIIIPLGVYFGRLFMGKK